VAASSVGAMLLLAYDVDLVPTGGCAVYSGVAPFAKQLGKDPAGHAFHRLCLLQLGLLGAAAHGLKRSSPA
jgi:hypothetical protein